MRQWQIDSPHGQGNDGTDSSSQRSDESVRETGTFDFMPQLWSFASAGLLVVLGWLLKGLSEKGSQKTIFDHRLRLEKEYGLYSELWDKLFELRRAIGQLVEVMGHTSEVQHGEQVLDLFNAFQATVRKGEPFMCMSVFGPAAEAATRARRIVSNIGKQESIGEHRQANLSTDIDEKFANQQIELAEQNDTLLAEFEDLFQRVSQAIRARVSP